MSMNQTPGSRRAVGAIIAGLLAAAPSPSPATAHTKLGPPELAELDAPREKSPKRRPGRRRDAAKRLSRRRMAAESRRRNR